MPFQSKSGGGITGGLDRFVSGVKAQTPPVLIRAALVLEGNIKTILLTPGTGRVYKRGKNITHQASAPGDPPAPDIGTLQRSITHELDGNSVRVGTNVEYAEPLEFGTTNAGKNHDVVILPRPFMRPALAASKEQMTEAVVATLKRGSARGN